MGSQRARFRQPVRLELRPHLRDIVAQHDDVVFAPLTIADMVAKERFRPKAKAFEQSNGAGLIDRHLHDYFFEPGLHREREHFLGQRPPYAKTAAFFAPRPCEFRRHEATRRAGRKPARRSQ